nr:MAG TPA: hypothetical protein [Caudoviricetes sp.]DAS68683.1 MAG TPA: hypothetical protein [Caudoviricetes sp.]
MEQPRQYPTGQPSTRPRRSCQSGRQGYGHLGAAGA